jgi:hypothetical protein
MIMSHTVQMLPEDFSKSVEIGSATREGCGHWTDVSVPDASMVHHRLPACCSLDTSRQIMRYWPGNDINPTGSLSNKFD